MKLNSQNLRAARCAYSSWLNSKNYTLYHAYQNPSYSKERAYDYCLEKFRLYNGEDFKIIGSNSFVFTVGFVFTDVQTDEKMFFYITPYYDIIVPVTALFSNYKPTEIMKKFPNYYEH